MEKENDIVRTVVTERYVLKEIHIPEFTSISLMIEGSNWSTHASHGNMFRVCNNGTKLITYRHEGLYEVLFDVDKKTVSIKVRTQVLPENAPRTADLSDTIPFFDALRDNLEDFLIKGGFKSVVPNADRTVFEVS